MKGLWWTMTEPKCIVDWKITLHIDGERKMCMEYAYSEQEATEKVMKKYPGAYILSVKRDAES